MSGRSYRRRGYSLPPHRSVHQLGLTQRLFRTSDTELYLLQIDSKKLGEGLIYETAVDSDFFGQSWTSIPLRLDAVTKAEKITGTDGILG